MNAEAAKAKFHGKTPEDWGGTLYHGTAADLQPGDQINTNYGYAHATTNQFVAASYGRLRAGNKGHVYEVEPTGAVEQDFVSGLGANSTYRSQHHFRVVRKLNKSADDIYFDTLMGKRSQTWAARWASNWVTS